MQRAIEQSERLLESSGKGYVCVTGVHGVMESRADPALREILNRAFLCVPDGMPTVWVGRLQGHRLMQRVYGPDYMMAMCRLSLSRGYRHFFYGGAPGIAEKLVMNLLAQMPELQVAGTCTPPFEPLNAKQESELVALIAKVRPDIFWVGLSTPKQERFMAEYLERLDVKLMAGVGAAFDLHAGLRRDAPGWMKSAGLQWLHRLYQEPWRLGPRYIKTNPRFLWEICGQLARPSRLSSRFDGPP
jgi:N-acetylglucosaminyldiphosphoundecaprenol N-acetyl-beta-D-mannosaminyltransferase